MAVDPKDLAEQQFANPQASAQGVNYVAEYATDVPLLVDGLLEALAPTREDWRILELGFGTGWLLELLAEHYPSARLFGLDLSPAMAAQVRLGVPRAALACGDMEKAPFADRSFDAVASCCALYFAADIDTALNEIKRLTARGGRVVINTVHPDNLKELDAFSREVLDETPLEDVAYRFDMETGWPSTLAHFPNAERVDWRGEMVLPDVAAFMGYWSSFHHRELAVGGDALRDRARRIAGCYADPSGRVRLTRASGAFIAVA